MSSIAYFINATPNTKIRGAIAVTGESEEISGIDWQIAVIR